MADAGIRSGDLVLDIGAGTGALTRPLLDAGARVVAIELHPARARVLRDRFPDRDVIVVQCDASDLRLPRRPFKVVANPPFGIATSVVRRLLHPRSLLVSADLVLPRHAAVRWASSPGAQLGRRIPSRAFVPAPPGPIAVLRVVRSPHLLPRR